MLTQEFRPAVAAVVRVRKTGRRRAGALLCSVAAGIVVAAIGPADASLARKFQPKRSEEAKKEQPSFKGPLMIDVSIANQRLTLFDDGVAIAHAPVSTGMTGHPTPMGVFSVIQKQKWHQSNIYSGAPMPYMQRITWSGVALHAGVLPGYPASHGCIRMPHDFAVRLYGITKMGARVFVTRNEIVPVTIANSRLFTPKPLDAPPATPPVVDNTPVDANRPERVASTQSLVPIDIPQSVDGPTRKKAPPTTPESNAEQVGSNRASTPEATTTRDTVASAAPQSDPPTPDQMSVDKTEIRKGEGAGNDPNIGEVRAGGSATTDTRSKDRAIEPKSAVQQKAEVAATPDQDKSADVTNADDPHSGTGASQDDASKIDGTSADVPLPPVRPQLVQLKPGPLSIFVSRKLARLFVRKGFDPVFDAPVTITNPTVPLGTHVFTAAGYSDDSHSAMRWLLVSLPSEMTKKEERRAPTGKGSHNKRDEKTAEAPADAPATEAASAALDRIDIPQDTRERIAELLVPGASLIISDKDLGPETGTESDTDFIVLTR